VKRKADCGAHTDKTLRKLATLYRFNCMIFQVHPCLHPCLGDKIKSNVYFRPRKGPTNNMKNKLNSKKNIAKMSIEEWTTKTVLGIPGDKVDNELEHMKGWIGMPITEVVRFATWYRGIVELFADSSLWRGGFVLNRKRRVGELKLLATAELFAERILRGRGVSVVNMKC